MAIGIREWRVAFAVASLAACSSSENGDSNDEQSAGGGAGGAWNLASGGVGFPGTGSVPYPGPGGAPVLPTCGNGRLDSGEECDGAPPTCAVATMNARPNGSATCNGCHLDASACSSTTGSGGATGTGGTNTGNTGNVPPTTGGFPGLGGAPTGDGGAPASAGGTASSNGGAAPTNDLDALRQVCVDTINEYRATLGLPALKRANASVEMCSDEGAQSDAAAGVAHGSAGNCPGMGAQDTCPGWGTAQYGGEANALKQCLSQMWAEGEPPEGRAQCLQEYFSGNTACFLSHGHYLNMSDSGNGTVSCGFYRMAGGRLWMNQDLGR